MQRASILFAGAFAAAGVQTVTVPPIDTRKLATKTEVQAAQSVADTAAANACPPGTGVPPIEAVIGTAGSAATCRRSDAVSPRISRSAIVQTVSGGIFSVTWASALPAPPVVILTPVSAASSIDCQLTAVPTTTTVQGRCFTAQTTSLNLTIVTAGLSLNPVANTAAGVSVHVLASPVTQ